MKGHMYDPYPHRALCTVFLELFLSNILRTIDDFSSPIWLGIIQRFLDYGIYFYGYVNTEEFETLNCF